MLIIFGAYLESSFLGSGIAFNITSFKIYILATLVLSNASLIISLVKPSIFISTWIAVIPFFVPATLKSISPKKSSKPWISVSIIYLLLSVSSVTRPVEIPATGSFIGTPAAISAIVLPQILPCDVEPFEDRISDTTLIVYGNSSCDGITGAKALSASAPCPISLLPGPREGLASPTLYGGKL